MRVLFPAPFSPRIAWISPSPAESDAPASAAVGPNARRASFTTRRGLAIPSLTEPFLQIGLEQLFYLRLIHRVCRHDLRPGIDALLDGLPAELLRHGLHGQVAHIEWVL